MANLTRFLQKIFAKNSNQIGVFGTGVNKQTSTNVETLQSADYEDGWSAAIITNKNYPILQERDGVDYGFSYQLAYLFQKGIPEWLSTETYYTNDYCRVGNEIYYSLQDNNIGKNPSTETTYWQRYINQGSFVAKTGDTMSGGLALQYGKPFISLNSTDVTYNTAPATTDLYTGVSLNDTNGAYMGYMGVRRFVNNDTENRIAVRGADGNETYIAVQKLANGTKNTYAPASDAVNSIVTTVSMSKSGNGYVKLGNGIIIQWGVSTFSADRTPVTVTYPTAFTDTGTYQVVVSGRYVYYDGDVSYGNVGANPTSSTTCTVYNERNTSYPEYFNWIAIGY